ncbi:alkaline phosphatase D family protein [Altererythrobacter sp.]|uniref:alkaline phosphatase D family protein n=1 Tax=Altererythrobacter sp. TaxID=1872480 RepID=UPI003D0EC2E1
MSSFAADRRRVIAGLAASSAAAAFPFRTNASEATGSPVFQHGVASGDPDATSVVLWTRITAEGQQDVVWEVASDLGFREVVVSGSYATGPDRDHTVKLLATGLNSGATYYYRFRLGNAVSIVGCTRTLPVGKLDRLGIALVSCSNYPFGYFNAYDAIASDASVEYVLHTGDYIYEYGADGWGGDLGAKIGRVHEPANEIVSLADYRQRHAQYKTDAGAQAMHAAHPLLACWDDHESANNPWTGGAQNHQPETEGDWHSRRRASIQAYYEWMPVREPEWLDRKGGSRKQFWRCYNFGDLAMLHTLETRHTARARQIDYADFSDHGQATHDAVMAAVNEPGRRMLASELERDLSAALRSSVDAGQPWRLIGNPMPIARTEVPDVVALGLVGDPEATPGLPEAAQTLAWKGKHRLPFYPDTWDGYGWARERLYDLSRKAGAGDLLFLTGDSHSFWANRLGDGEGRLVGIELGTAGVSSPGDFVGSGFDALTSAQLDKAFADFNPEIEWTDNLHQGYVRLELSHGSATASFIAVDTVLSPQYRTDILQRINILRRNNSVDLAIA